MPLPDANNYSMRIYELLKETDLENLSYSQFQGVAEKLFIEPENEDEMRRLVLVQLARMAVRGDWDGFLNGGSGSGAPADAEYLLAFDASIPASLTAARKLVVGNNISMAHGAGANDDVTLSATPGGSDGQIQYNISGVLSATGLLSTNKTNELTIVAISGDGTINISSSTKAVSLICDENQKLKVKGATDTFVFDVSSSSGGITFPDGSVQSTASSGGGGTFNLELPGTVTNSGTNNFFLISRMPGWGSNSNSASVINFDENPRFWPWISPVTGDLTLSIDVTSDGTGTLALAIYSDSNGVPSTKIGGNYTYVYGTSGTGVKNLTPASTVSVTRGTQYWLGGVESVIGNGAIRSESGGTYIAGPRAPPSSLSSITMTGVGLETSDNTLPASITASDLLSNTIAQPRWGGTFA